MGRVSKHKEIASNLLRSIKRFQHLDLTLLEAEILARLMDGRRTSNELVFEIFGSSRGGPSYSADYYKVRRAIRSLESRGFTSSPLISKVKPYHLTRHGVLSIISIGDLGWEPPHLVQRIDVALYLVSTGFAVILFYTSRNLGPSSLVTSYLSVGFILSVGASLVRITETIRRVF